MKFYLGQKVCLCPNIIQEYDDASPEDKLSDWNADAHNIFKKGRVFTISATHTTHYNCNHYTLDDGIGGNWSEHNIIPYSPFDEELFTI